MNSTDPFQPSIEKITLEKIRQSIQTRVSSAFLESVQYKEVVDIRSKVIDAIIYELRYSLFGIKRKVKKEILRPIDWWNAFKARFFPDRLLKRFPVRYETIPVDVEVIKVCPHLNIAEYPDHIAWFTKSHEYESDWRYDKSVPFYLKETIRLLETAAYLLEHEYSFMSNELQTQAEKLKEIL